MSFATADALGVGFGDVVKVETPEGSLNVSAFPRGGIRDDAVAIPVGQGHNVGYYASMENDGGPGETRGVNVMDVLPARPDGSGSRVWLANNALLQRTGEYRRLALSQWTDNQRGRGLAQSVSLAEANGHAEDHGDGHGGGHHEGPPHTFDPAYDAEPGQPYRWGMSIDIDRCNGCAACVAAATSKTMCRLWAKRSRSSIAT